MDTLDATLDRFCDAWNRHDADDLASLWSEDGELNHPWGMRAVGRDAIRKLLADEHRGAMAGSAIRIARLTPISSDHNIVAQLDTVLDNVLAPNGRLYSLQPSITAMFVPVQGEWRIKTMSPLPQNQES